MQLGIPYLVRSGRIDMAQRSTEVPSEVGGIGKIPSFEMPLRERVQDLRTHPAQTSRKLLGERSQHLGGERTVDIHQQNELVRRCAGVLVPGRLYEPLCHRDAQRLVSRWNSYLVHNDIALS